MLYNAIRNKRDKVKIPSTTSDAFDEDFVKGQGATSFLCVNAPGRI